jgi:hypothetical protein
LGNGGNGGILGYDTYRLLGSTLVRPPIRAEGRSDHPDAEEHRRNYP